MKTAQSILLGVAAFALLLVLCGGVKASNDYLFTYGGPAGWYTYNPADPYDRSYPSQIGYQYYGGQGLGYQYPGGGYYAYQPPPRTEWVCVGSGCTKTPYLLPMIARGGSPYYYDSYYYDFGGPAVFQPWQ